MTSVAVTDTTQTVVVTEGGGTTVVTVPSAAAIVQVNSAGPQGPSGAGSMALGDLTDVNTTQSADGSLLYYSAAASKFLADAGSTILTLTDGGNF